MRTDNVGKFDDTEDEKGSDGVAAVNDDDDGDDDDDDDDDDDGGVENGFED